jgi:GTP-dependent phosphoenolpyruvate carboxykinase
MNRHLMSALRIVAVILSGTLAPVQADVYWNGSVDADWANATNWTGLGWNWTGGQQSGGDLSCRSDCDAICFYFSLSRFQHYQW